MNKLKGVALRYQRLARCSWRRLYSSQEPSAIKASSRLERTHSRLPRFLQKYTTPLLNAPITHISAFLLLHELTAIIPLVGLAATFHYTQWLPPFIFEWQWVSIGVEKFGKYFRRKGWLGEESGRRSAWWGRGEGATRWVVEVATAWAITKALLPARLILSVWATPWFARISVIPFTNGVKRIFGRGKRNTMAASGAAVTGATGAGQIAKAGAETPTKTTRAPVHAGSDKP